MVSQIHRDCAINLTGQKIIVGRLEMLKRQESPKLVCIEPAQIPLEGILVARGIPGAFVKIKMTCTDNYAIKRLISDNVLMYNKFTVAELCTSG
jgi:hypothetical protein